MNISSWVPGNEAAWKRQLGDILSFVRKYGKRHISTDTYRALMKLSYDNLMEPGSSILFATIRTEDGIRHAGLSVVTSHGKDISLVVVHPLYRSHGIGSQLLARQLDILGQLSCQVPIHHISCLHMCFQSGLTAKRLIKVRGGRTMLLLDEKPISSNRTANILQRR